MDQGRVKIFTSLDANELEDKINGFLEQHPDANTAINFRASTTTDSENRIIPLYSAMIYYT